MIKSGNVAEIQNFIRRMGSDVRALVKSCLELSYYSRGSWSYQQVLMMSQAERELATDFINERLKAASKQMFPVY